MNVKALPANSIGLTIATVPKISPPVIDQLPIFYLFLVLSFIYPAEADAPRQGQSKQRALGDLGAPELNERAVAGAGDAVYHCNRAPANCPDDPTRECAPHLCVQVALNLHVVRSPMDVFFEIEGSRGDLRRAVEALSLPRPRQQGGGQRRHNQVSCT